MAFNNLPGIFDERLDGNLAIVPVNNNPIVVVLGTANKGDSEELFVVNKVSNTTATYGTTGTLSRGLYEVSTAGALNMRVFRIGATAAVLETVGGGITIETIAKDDSAGTDYKLLWLDVSGRLRVWRTSDDELVYDNNPAAPLDSVDIGEVVVSGDQVGLAGDVPALGGSTVDDAITLLVADGVSGAVFIAGTDGTSLSKMATYQALYNAYELLEDQELDVVMPMGVYLNDLNIMDMTEAVSSGLGLPNLTTFPLARGSVDALGKLYVEEVAGVNQFWWWFPTQPNASAEAFVAAQLWPSGVTDCTATTTPTVTLDKDNFHEVNFGYQLANFCYGQSVNNTDMTGTIGVLPPSSFSAKDVSQWVGQLPTTEVDTNGNIVISANGTGLLGNKFMSGRLASGGASGTPGFQIDGVDGLYNGGFIATDTGWLDDIHIKDSSDTLVDIGKYISIVGAWPTLANPSRTSAYSATGAATYGGFYSTLAPESAPTNKLLRNLRLPFRLNTTKLDALAGQRYVTFHQKTRGIVVSDSPSAARPNSDYRRLSTMRQVKAVIDAIRRIAEPFLGDGMSAARLQALDTAIDKVLRALVKRGVIRRAEHQVTSTQTQRVQGKATVELKLVPAFELRQLTIVTALSAS